ncbi:MAG: hypothetical protein WCC99_24260 [Candidatus Sulfotelmatobacter sp.]
MANRAIPSPVEQKRWKELFEGSLTSLNGGTIPASQRPIFRLKQSHSLETDSKTALTTAAASLAALWQISPNRPHRTE